MYLMVIVQFLLYKDDGPTACTACRRKARVAAARRTGCARAGTIAPSGVPYVPVARGGGHIPPPPHRDIDPDPLTWIDIPLWGGRPRHNRQCHSMI